MNLILMPVKLGIENTKNAIESCQHQTIGKLQILVIDDASEDCGPYLRSLIGPFIQVTYSRPRGLSHAWNDGLRWAFDKLKLPYALVINNDIIMRPDTYATLVDTNESFVTGVGVDTMEAAFQPREDLNLSRSPHPCFSCFLIRKAVWDVIGEFDETFWAWAGDGDYHLRMDQAGIDAWAVNLPFYHAGGGSSTIRDASPDLHEEFCRISDRDRATFFRKWGCKIGSDEYYAKFRTRRNALYQETGRLGQSTASR